MNSSQSIKATKEQSNLLKKALRGNALFSGLSGAIALLGAQPLAAFTGIDVARRFLCAGDCPNYLRHRFVVGFFTGANRPSLRLGSNYSRYFMGRRECSHSHF